MEQAGLLFPKPGKPKKKKIVHPKSILHSRISKTCFLCVLLANDWREYTYLEEHHLYPGNPDRRKSEEYGLKVYLCPAHHRTGPDAVHNNSLIMRRLQATGQQAFEERYPELNWMEIFGKDYKEAYEMEKSKRTIMDIIQEKKCPCIQRLGSYAVYTTPDCPEAHLIKGIFAVSKFKCVECGGRKQ